ncbi:S-adenosyl-L-methionine-dependent methyltransferase [Amniculicola lignicola CBS 123094]|uniref:S-adenosyl-L-methionine-dependent methyltransferase n=1 Tax=Amniculicola lignicola CBS 123094 TaxID=1392246 RepID=A0A6A5W2U6_9PLEO|nr:S-adenosyl-L-methionine-dependent methyltransferase [Amniculicola lignicola CBS 123094]
MASSSSAPPPTEPAPPTGTAAPAETAIEPQVQDSLHIEAEVSEQGSDADSAYGDDLESYTTSLKSTVLNYRFENGRRYHAFKEDEKKYYFPNDDEESDRLDLYHHIQTLRLGGELHLAPIGDNPQRILDVATGTGIWAIDMGDKYPSAEILGNDLSPTQPSLVPPNVKFEVDDIEDEWVYSSKFDFIHARYLTCSIRDWPKLVRQIWKNTKPGGWVEFQDFETGFYTSANGDFTPDSPLGDWCNKLADAVRSFGIEPDPGPKIEGWVKEVGFTNVVAKTLPLPVGTWPKDKTLKEIGAFNLIMYLDNLEAITLRLWTTAFGWSAEEVKVLCAQLRPLFKNPRARMQHNWYVVYAQKPLDAVD